MPLSLNTASIDCNLLNEVSEWPVYVMRAIGTGASCFQIRMLITEVSSDHNMKTGKIKVYTVQNYF